MVRPQSSPRRTPPPLDAPALDRLALRYVERFATTRGKLADYLRRKLRERGWSGEGEPDPVAVAERMASLGYVDDRGFAEARVAAMGRRGLGARRIVVALRAAGIDAEDGESVQGAVDAQADASAMAFARRRRIGPFATAPVDRAARERALSAMMRAGHPYEISRRIVDADGNDLSDNGDDDFV